MIANTTTRRRQSGYNLIEVLLAMAMLGVVVISVFTLFFIGRRNVYSGKQTSQAVALGTQILEDLAPLNKKLTYQGAFGITDDAVGTAFTVPAAAAGGATYPYTKSNIRSTDPNIVAGQTDISTQNTPPGLLTRWAGLIGNRLTNGTVTVVLTPDQDTGKPATSPVNSYVRAQLLRIRVFVRWDEAGRRREVVLDTVKAF